jgi:competence protein ComEC
MGLVGALGVLFGRKTNPQNILLLVGVGIGIFFTHQLFLDFGFWLSFLATMGIILWTDKLEFELGKIFPGKYLPMVLSVTLAAQLAVAPLLLWWFQEISVASLLANLFVEPLVLPIILLSLALAFIPFGAMIIAFPLLVFLEIILIISQLSGWFSPLNLGLFPTIIIGIIIYSKMLRDLLVKE